jgi:hypothetical protein
MPETNDFDELYNTKLLPATARLRAECTKSDNWGIVALLSFVAFMVIAYLGMQQGIIPGYGWYVLLLIIIAVIGLSKYRSNKNIFTEDFKDSIIRSMINDLCDNVSYHPDEYIAAADYEQSSLYRYYYENYTGSDLMEGTVEGMRFLFSQLATSYVDVNTERNIFKGIFFAIQFPYGFSGCTYVWHQDAVQLARSIYDEDYRLMPMPAVDAVGTGDAAFEDCYCVYSTYAAEAISLLTPQMRQQLVLIARSAATPVSFSFVQGYMYVAIQSAKDLFAPSDYDPGDKDEMYKYYLTIQLITGIIKMLRPA